MGHKKAIKIAQRTRQKKRPIENVTKPNQDLLERVRARCDKRKAEEAEENPKPSKQACEREERIATIQLKAYWQCYPLIGNTSSNSGGNDENDAAGQTKTEVQQMHKGSERKLLLARLKGSIEESIKRRKTEELPQMQENSNSGEDQKEPDSGTRVRLGGDDHNASESSSSGVQPCFNKGNIVGTAAKTAPGNANKREAQSIMNLIQAGKAKMTKTKS